MDHFPDIVDPVIWKGTQYQVSHPLKEHFSIFEERPGGLGDDKGVFKTY